ncbi:MAG: hypothetical protein ACJAVV_002019 [Alphaproteobacteria bacterium]|jgi:hypothetical protein
MVCAYTNNYTHFVLFNYQENRMPVKLEDRPIETVKEEVIDVLVHNYSHGFISNEAFERRLDKVIETTSHQAMMDQIADLDATPNEEIKQQKEQQFSVNYNNEVSEESETIVNILGSSDRSGQWVVPRVIKVYSILGGATIDFTDARFNSPNVKVQIISVLGGDKIYVPENVNIVSKAFCVLGSIDNKAPSIASRQAPTITIEGLILFSSLDIKIKVTIKEKFIAFANQMKEMFDTNPK